MINANLFYGWEKFHLAVLGLARGSNSPRERLYFAVIHNLMTLGDEHLPTPELQKELAHIKGTVLSGGGHDRPMAGYSEDEVLELINSIVGIYDKVARQMPTN